MRYALCTVFMPWTDTAGMKNWTKINLTGIIDRRKLLRGVRKFILSNFGIHKSNDWIKLHCVIGGFRINPKGQIIIPTNKDMPTKEELDRRLDEMCAIRDEVKNEIEDERTSSVQERTSESTGEQVCSL